MNAKDRASQRIARLAKTTYEGPAVVVRDCLADLRHFCDQHGVDFAAEDRIAYNHYCEERHHES